MRNDLIVFKYNDAGLVVIKKCAAQRINDRVLLPSGSGSFDTAQLLGMTPQRPFDLRKHTEPMHVFYL